MEKVKFIYIGKSFENRIPKSEFFALKLSKKDKQTLYPHLDEKEIKNTTILIPHTDEYLNKNEVFVQGIGWKKFGNTNKVVVPLFSGNVEDWDDYIEKYGKQCLFYSLSGYSLYSHDCCAIPLIREFHSIMQCKGGIKQYQKFVENIEKIQQIQLDVFNNKLSFLADWEIKRFIDNHLFRPCYNVFFVSMPPYLDTPTDDKKLEEFYRKYRKHEIETNHAEYGRLKELEDLVEKSYKRDYYGQTNEYYNYLNEKNEILKRINEVVIKTMDKEIEDGIFPICMSDRIKFLFGDECNELYNFILNNF